MILDLSKFPSGHDQYYQFLEWLPTQLPKDWLIFEGGTWEGLGARALAGQGHRVKTFDPWPRNIVALPPNASVHGDDIFDIDPSDLRSCDLFYLDIDPHEGASEAHFYHHLIKIGFRGLVLCDDIDMNPGMQAFWKRIAHPKTHLGTIAHATGTGIISFNHDVTIIPPAK